MFNYTVKSIRVPSRWFDVPDNNKNTFSKMGGYKGFYLYLQLYKFRIHQQDNDHTFITSISLLRKETKYTTDEIFNLLKKLKGSKIITIAGVSRWEYMLDGDGNIKEDKILHITTNSEESFPIHTDFNTENDDYYIYISFDLLNKYEEKKLDEKHFALHCLIQRLQRNKKKVCYMSVEKMAEVLSIDKDTVNRMIINMNRHYFLVSWRKDNSSKRGQGSTRYEHITYEENGQFEDKEMSHWDGWLFRYQTEMDKITKRADRKKERKKNKSVKVENKNVNNIKELPSALGTKKDSWGEDNPFGNISDHNVNENVEDDDLDELFA